MKAKTKLTKLWTILLSLVMLLSLLPTTALAATYPGSVRVYNASGAITSLDDGECLVTNNGSATSYAGGTSYVARYDSGTLYLKDYHGVAADGQIYADGDLNIVVENDSSFTTSVSTTNNLYGIQAGGKLNISGSGKLTVTANGDGNVYGICANEGVTISAPLDVQVGKVDSSKNGPVYGIYTRSGAISLSGADKTITATGGAEFACGVYNEAKTSSTAADNGNINISGKLTVNLSNGFYNRGISSQGGDITLNGATVKILGSYYYGIFNKSGNVVIKSCPDVELTSTTSGGDGICTYDGGDLNIEDSTVKVSANGLAAELKGNVSIKDSMVDLTRTSSYYEVIKTDNSSATITIDLSTEGSVTLTASGEQTNNAMITGKVTLVGSTKCEKGRRNGSSYDGVYDGSSKTVLQFVHEGPAPATYTVSFDANGGTGTMADVTGVTGEYTLPANGFTAPSGKQFKAWSVGGSEKAVGDKITVTANTTVTAVWEDIPVVTYTVSFDANGGTGSMADVTGVSGEYMLPANGFTAPSGKQFKAWSVGGVEKAAGDTITVNANTTVTAIWENIPVVTYTVSFDANGGTGTMTDVTGVSGEYTLPANSFTAPDGKQFKAWSVGGVEKAAGDKITVTANTTVTAVWEAIEYNVTVTGGTASVGAGTPITKATMGTTVTLTAGAAPTGQMFDKWVVNGVVVDDANSATTTFVMPAGNVTAEATYKNAPHTHTYNQETVKPEALKTPADCTSNAVYFKSCSCGAISTTDTFAAMGTALGHAYGSDWKYDSTNHWHECSRCHDKNDEAAHSASEWIIDTAATETAEGAKHKECTVCKKVLETATIPATGSSHTHSYGVYVGMTYTAGNFIYQITSIDTATLGQSKVIGVVAAKKNKITEVTIPDRADCKGYRLNVTTIGNDAFAGCKALKKLTIGNKVTVIGKNAFKKCSKLETVVIGKAVKTISSKAFIGDNKIKKITFKGKKLKTVNKNAFSKKAEKNIKSKKTKLKGNKKAIKLFKKKLKIK